MKKKIIVCVVILIVIGVAYWLISPLWGDIALQEGLPGTGTVTEEMPAGEPTILGRAALVAKAHDVEGEALIVISGNETFLRFENLKTINGPDVRIYLSADLDAKDFIDLGPIRATEGNVNYSIPTGTDLTKYTKALIWCRTFGVLFSYAEL